jgi:RNA polymerase sigma-70 factor, ECF subfamily
MDDWHEVFEQHGSLVWATVYRILGDHAESLDCCQEVFAELLARPIAQPVRNWAGYLKWLATRRAIDDLRRRRMMATRFEPDHDIAIVAVNQSAPEAETLADELRERLKDELSRLPPQQAQAFWLVSIEELSYEETSGHLGVDPAYVGVLVHRARSRLREWLAELNPVAQRSSPSV